MTKKRAAEVEEDDVVVDRIGFLRTVVNIVTFPAKKAVGWVVGLIYQDGGSEHYDFDHKITTLDDERDS